MELDMYVIILFRQTWNKSYEFYFLPSRSILELDRALLQNLN
jgi:hypothetical protein